jgi:hypothetical protein
MLSTPAKNGDCSTMKSAFEAPLFPGKGPVKFIKKITLPLSPTARHNKLERLSLSIFSGSSST